MHTHVDTEAQLAPSGEGTVVLDVGGTRGAAVIFTTTALAGVEIEIRPVDGPWDGTHTAVRRRDLRDGVAYAGVFGSLPEGSYHLRVRQEGGGPSGDPAVELRVAGGEVVQLEWPTA